MDKETKKIIRIAIAISVTILFAFGTNILNFALAQSQSTAETTAILPQNGDTVTPSDIENLKATPGDSEVMLSWNAATDNVGVTGYKIYRGTKPVKNEQENYDLPVIPAGNVTSYIVKNLMNGQTYYFSVTAVDAAQNESPNYAVEVNAKPMAGLRASSIEDDGKAPQVKEIKAEDIVSVQVIFSEPVKLPEEHPASAFRIEKLLDKSRLEVQRAEIDNRDDTGATVLLTTAPQEEGVDYVLTAGIEMQDYYNNPIISGTSDTGSFKGSAKRKPKEQTLVATSGETPTAPVAMQQDKEAPHITEGMADFNNRIALTFSEKIVLPENPRGQITIVKKGGEEKLNLINASLSVDGKTLYLTTDPQEAVEYEVALLGIADEAGNALAADSGTFAVTGKGSSLEDLIPPEDVTNLIARIKDAQTNLVELRWEASKNSAGDLADQMLYNSPGKNSDKFDDGTSLGHTTTGSDIEGLKGGKWYTFKITTKDDAGNESVGALTSLFLPQTGPGAIAAGLTGLFMGFWRRRKK